MNIEPLKHDLDPEIESMVDKAYKLFAERMKDAHNIILTGLSEPEKPYYHYESENPEAKAVVKPQIYYPVPSKRFYYYHPIMDPENICDDIYIHKSQDVRAIEYKGYDSISEFFGNLRVLDYFRKTSIGTVELINGDIKLRLGNWIVWRNELNVQILTKEQFDKEFFSPKK